MADELQTTPETAETPTTAPETAPAAPPSGQDPAETAPDGAAEAAKAAEEPKTLAELLADEGEGLWDGETHEEDAESPDPGAETAAPADTESPPAEIAPGTPPQAAGDGEDKRKPWEIARDERIARKKERTNTVESALQQQAAMFEQQRLQERQLYEERIKALESRIDMGLSRVSPDDPFEAAKAAAKRAGLTDQQFYEQWTERLANEGRPGGTEALQELSRARTDLQKAIDEQKAELANMKKALEQERYQTQQQLEVHNGVRAMHSYVEKHKAAMPWLSYAPAARVNGVLEYLVRQAVAGELQGSGDNGEVLDFDIAMHLDREFAPLYASVLESGGKPAEELGNPPASRAEKPVEGQGNPPPEKNGARKRVPSNRTAAASSKHRSMTEAEREAAYHKLLEQAVEGN